MAKWPNVPDCYGWLHLNAQGQWLMGELGQANDAPSVVAHEGLRGFMNRNYVCPFPQAAYPNHPKAGAWALQNGPQRVWVTLALAPFALQVHRGVFSAHTGEPWAIDRLIQSSDGVIYCTSGLRVGAIASRSMADFSEYVQAQDAGLAWYSPDGAPPLMIEGCDAARIESTLGFARSVMP